jgi:hypothetical protein
MKKTKEETNRGLASAHSMLAGSRLGYEIRPMRLLPARRATKCEIDQGKTRHGDSAILLATFCKIGLTDYSDSTLTDYNPVWYCTTTHVKRKNEFRNSAQISLDKSEKPEIMEIQVIPEKSSGHIHRG